MKVKRVLAVALLFYSLFLSLPWYLCHQIESAAHLDLQGKIIPSLFLPEFKIQNFALNWEEKVRTASGQMRVKYDLLGFLTKKILHLSLKGSNIRGELLGGWAKSQAVSSFDLDHFYAEVVWDSTGLREIQRLEASSPQFQFQIKPSDK